MSAETEQMAWSRLHEKPTYLEANEAGKRFAEDYCYQCLWGIHGGPAPKLKDGCCVCSCHTS